MTANVRTIRSIPLKLTANYPHQIEIRGEIFLCISGFEKMNEIRTQKGLDPFSNPRNTASGSLKLLDANDVSMRPLDCFLYYLLGDNLPTQNHYDNLQEAIKWGFKIPVEIEKHTSIENVVRFIKKWDKLLGFEIEIIIPIHRKNEEEFHYY